MITRPRKVKQPESPFVQELKSRIKALHKDCLREGTVGLGFESFFAAVSGKGIHCFKGAPLGTNGTYYFKEKLRELIAELKLQSFIID